MLRETLCFLAIAAATQLGVAAPGDLDTNFGSNGVAIVDLANSSEWGNAVAIQPDGKIIMVGYTSTNPPSVVSSIIVVRLTSQGTLDTEFGGGDGIATVPLQEGGSAHSVALQRGGEIVVVGDRNTGTNQRGIFVFRFTSVGLLDSSFGGGDGKVETQFGSAHFARTVAIQPDGKIVVGGSSNYESPWLNLAVLRYTDSGVLDSDFGGGDGIVTTDISGGMDGVSSLVLQPDGRIVIAGYSHNGTDEDIVVARYTNSGVLDPDFGGGDGIVVTPVGSGEDFAASAAMQRDGKVVVAGYSRDEGGVRSIGLIRYTSAGALDQTFGTGGVVTSSVDSSSVASASVLIDHSDKIVVAGTSVSAGTGDTDFLVSRYDPTGLLDTTFGGGDGLVTTPIGVAHDGATAIAFQKDGKILAAGYSHRSDGTGRIAVARYLGDGPDADNDTLLDHWELSWWPSIHGQGPLDDFDLDGFEEILEMGLGLNPTQPSSGGTPQIAIEGGYLTMTIHKQPGVLYEVQTGGSLAPSGPDSFDSSSTTVLIDDATTLKVRDNQLVQGGVRRFIRVLVTGSP